jgi:ribonucleoside-diphosphate reductase alpha chain
VKVEPALDYHALNAMLNLYDDDGRIQLDKDRLAARQYFLQHVNQNTVFFHNLREKLDAARQSTWEQRQSGWERRQGRHGWRA